MADMILRNARVTATAAVADGVIVEVGDEAAVKEKAGSHTNTVTREQAFQRLFPAPISRAKLCHL